MSESIFGRYTDVTSLLHILTKKEITLLDPNTWDDQNDSKYLNIYKEKRKLSSVLALCFTEAPETYHHWKVFAPGNAGICIRFERDRLIECIKKTVGIKHRKVDYLEVNKLQKNRPETNDLPFIKRYPFRDEKEYRFLYATKKSVVAFKNVKIELDSISRIIMSPWLNETLAKTLKQVLKSIDGCEDIKIYSTTLKENKNWISYGKESI